MGGVIAAGDSNTVRAAAAVLRDGGNAIDAAVAGALAACVVEPMLASIGGGGMMVLRQPDGHAATIDFFSHAPGRGLGAPPSPPDFVAIDVDFGPATQVFHIGRGSSAAPRTLDGLATALHRYGTRTLADVTAPAIDMAERGFALSAATARVIELLWAIVTHDRRTADLYAAGGRPPHPGEHHSNPALSATLSAFVREGHSPEAFTRALLDGFGPDRGGWITEEDLTDPPEVLPPRTLRLGEWDVLTSPRIGGQLVAHVIERLPARDVVEPARVRAIAEACRTATAARDEWTMPGSTTHVSVVDDNGTAAAVTLTNGEGCGYLVGQSGVQLNNFLGEEDLNPHGFHRHAPGVALPTMIAPTIARRDDGTLVALGSGGANRIRSAVGQVLHALTGHAGDSSLAPAVLGPRVHAEADSAWLELEGLEDPAACIETLRDGFAHVHAFDHRDFFFGGAHAALLRADGSEEAIGDPRRGGSSTRVR